jgi:ketosteroid isomerase-like protein
MSSSPAEQAVNDLLNEADAAFAAGDADRWTACFEEGGQIFLLHREALEGRAAIHEFWEASSARLDTSDWNPATDLLDVNGDRAYAFRTYTERLLNREDGSRTLVRGRLVYFFRRDATGAWRIRLLMNSHSHPAEPIE